MRRCKLIECLGRPRCHTCVAMDAAYGAPQPLATVDTTPAGWAQLLIRGIVVSSKYGAAGRAELEEMARRVNAADGVRARCPACNGNDAEAPCAFPEGGQPGCLKDARGVLERVKDHPDA